MATPHRNVRADATDCASRVRCHCPLRLDSKSPSRLAHRFATTCPRMLSALALLIIVCAGCAPMAIVPPEPVPEAFSAEPKPAVSYLTLPVTVSSDSLAAELDRRLSDEPGENGIYFTENARTRIRGARVQFGVHRSGPSSVSTVDGQLTYRVPLAINSGMYHWHRCVPILGCRSSHGEFGGAGAILGTTDVAIDEDWRLVSKTRFSFSWVDGPWIDTDAQGERERINLHPVIDLFAGWRLRRLLRDYAERVDNRLSNFDIRAHIEAAWRRMHQPMQLASNPPIWLSVAPVSLGVGSPRSEGHDLQITPTLVATLRGQVGDKPAEIEPVPVLPKNRRNLEGGQIEIQLPVLVEYSYLNGVVRDRVAGRTFEFKNGARVTIKEARVSATGKRLVAQLDFDADRIPGHFVSATSGTVYLSGRLVLDAGSNRLSVRDFDYELATKEYLHKVADWLIHETFVQRIQERLVFDASRVMRPVLDRVEKGFAGIELSKGMTLTASVQEWTVDPDPVVGGNGISILVRIKGSARVHVVIAEEFFRRNQTGTAVEEGSDR